MRIIQQKEIDKLVEESNEEDAKSSLSKANCLEALKIDDKIHRHPIQLFKKNTILLYLGRCRRIAGALVITSKDEKWIGKKDIYNRQFAYVVDFILGKEELHIMPKISDVVYIDPFTGQFLPVLIGDELLYFKVEKLDEINVIIK